MRRVSPWRSSGSGALARPLRAEHLRQPCLSLLLNRLQVLGAAEAFRIDLVDVLGARRPGGEPAEIGFDLDAAERLAVAGRLAQGGADGIAGEILQAELLRRDGLQDVLLRRGGGDVDARVMGHAELGSEVVEELARIAAGLRHDLGREQAEDDAVLVGGPHRAVAAQERGACTLLAAETEAAREETVDKPFEADRGLDQLAAEFFSDA